MRAWVVVGCLLLAAGCTGIDDHDTVRPVKLGEASYFPTVEALTNSPIVEGNRVEILLNGDQIFPAILGVIRSARRSVTYLQYYMEESDIGSEIVDALAERCRAGVAGHVVLDGVGALYTPGEYVTRMQTAGCHVEWYHPVRPLDVRRVNNRNHRRILVADGERALTGGSGVSARWLGDGRTAGKWRETDVRVEGPIVRQLQAAFAESWRETTGVVLTGENYFPPLAPRGTVAAQAVRSSPARGSSEAYMLFLLAIESARRAIYVTNPYFLPDETMADALLRARRRGVHVIALVPGQIDHNLVRHASRADFGRLLLAGIEIHEYRAGLLHAKTMVVDSLWATIGSTNLDNRSFALNAALNLTVHDGDVAGRMERVFREDLHHSSPITYEQWKGRGLRAKALELLSGPIRNLL